MWIASSPDQYRYTYKHLKGLVTNYIFVQWIVPKLKQIYILSMSYHYVSVFNLVHISQTMGVLSLYQLHMYNMLL
jgi:hypothetical protein